MEFRAGPRTARLCVLFLVLAACAGAIDRERRLDQLSHTSWTAKDGAPGRARALVQTTDGFLWFGSEKGLHRFDGVRFELYEAASGVRLPKTNVSALLALPEGGLLIGWSHGGVTLLKDGKLTDYGPPGCGFPENGMVDWFRRGPDGSIWAMLSYRGPYRRDANGVWHEFGAAWPISGYPLLFDIDRNGTIWVGTAEKTFYAKASEKKFHQLPHGTSYLAQAPDGVIWTLNRSALRPVIDFMPAAPVLPSLGKWDTRELLLADSQGSLWGTRRAEGLFRIAHPERGLNGTKVAPETFTQADGLTSNDIGCFLEDREGNLWLTTAAGVDRFSQQAVVTVKLPVGGGYTFFDTPGNSVRVYGSQPFTLMTVTGGAVTASRPLPFSMLYVYRGRNGVTWVGTQVRGLQKSINNQFQPVDMSPVANRTDTVGTITADGNGRLWALVAGKGLFRLEDGKWASGRDLGIPRGTLSSFTDSRGRVWLGRFNNRVTLLDHDRIQTFSGKEGVNVGSVLDIREIAGTVFLGGDRGLQMFDGERFVPVVPNDTEAFRNIWAGVASERSGLWFGEARGVAHIPIEEIRKVVSNPKHAVAYEIYDALDGLVSDLQRSGFRPASIESSDGRVWFATQTNIVWIDPIHVARNRIVPNLSIDALAAGGRMYHFFSRVTLPPGTTSARIAFTAASMTIPERVRFRYKLEGVNEDWQDAGTRREAFYTNLGPGTYRFRVTACNNGGVWNEAGAAVIFGIAPTFYQTTWFHVLIALVAALSLWLSYRWRIRQIAAALNARCEERLEERTRLARDFHDTLLQTIQGSKLVADDALSRDSDLAQMRSTMERLSEWLGRAVHEGRSALTSLRSSISQGNDLAEAFERAADEYRLQHPMDVNLVVEGAAREMHPIVRDEVYRIGYEAILNAFTHSGGKRLDVELDYLNDLVLRIRDDGSGIPNGLAARGKEGHFGIIGMRERAARIGAKLTITTSPEGTEVELRVPRNIVAQRSTMGSKSVFQKLRDLIRR